MNGLGFISSWGRQLASTSFARHWLVQRLWTWLSAVAWGKLASGFCFACLLLIAIARFCLQFGFHTETLAALAVASGGVAAAGMLLRSHLNRIPLFAWWCVAGAWNLLVPTLLHSMTGSLSGVAWSQFSSDAHSIFLLSFVAVLTLGPLFLIAVHFCSFWTQERSSAVAAFVGMTLALFLVPLSVVPWLGTTWLAGILSAITFALAISEWMTKPQPTSDAAIEPLSTGEFVSQLALVCVLGVLLPAAFHVAHQLVTASLFSSAALFGGICFGAAACMFFGSQRTSVMTQLVILSIACAALLASYPLLTAAHLQLSTFVSSPWKLFGARLALTSLFTLPMGWLLASSFRQIAGLEVRQTIAVALLSAGVLCGLIAPWAPAAAFACVAWVALVAVTLTWGYDWTQTKSFAWGVRPVAALTYCCAIPAILLTLSNYTPEHSERLLFSSQTFYAVRTGTEYNWLTQLDDHRLVAQYENSSDRWSVWRFRANQYEIQHNGITTALAASPHSTGPLSPNEIVPVALPLTLAKQPDHVLLLGLNGPTMVTTALEFPVRSVTVVEPSAQAVELSQHLDEEFGDGVFRDDRVQVVNVPTQLAMATAAPQKYDVVVASASQAAGMSLQANYTVEFYANVKQHLTEGGVFCQRLAYFDLGPQVVRDVSTSLSEVFESVSLVETSPGELLFLATPRTTELVTEEWVERLQAEHCRRVFARVGWDWSVATRMSYLSAESFREYCEKGQASTVDNPHLSWQFPLEIARWDAKALQTRESLAAHAAALGSGLTEIENPEDIAHRLDDVQQKYKVMANNPDHYWAYRKVLKQRLQDRPRTELVQVRHEGLKRALHSEDARRKDYLETLGQIAQTEHPTAADIEALTQFCAPYDPLLSDFAHFEAAHLYSKSKDGDPRLAYNHWLHSVLYAPPEDRSVRNVCAALQMLNQFPESVETPVDRWDHINALLEVMERRWVMRMQSSDRTNYEPIDTNRSIKAVQLAVETLDELVDDVPVSQEDWNIRKAVIEDSLLRPLRAERSLQASRYSVKPNLN
ncbi:MAG: hypothetical protein KDA88_11040 [Planctomycetaceae bacterium]|nr:hypothetical protein [Planctomycetaceae bacterium]MCB9951112.1 hypothetical protein [Planctomycetaceae bacterium]